MPFPSSSSDLASGLALALKVAQNVRGRASSLSGASLAGPLSGGQIVDFAAFLADQRLTLDTVRQMNGIGPYAQSQLGSPALDIAAEFTAMLNAIDSTIAWMLTNFPTITDGSGTYLALLSWNGSNNGRTVFRQFSTAVLAGFRVQLDSLAATIS
jgi:hypothetical protein